MKRLQLTEQTAQSGLSVDKEQGLITGVKVLGLQSANRRRYTSEAVQEALPKYENIKVNIDHPGDNPREVRSLRDRLGKLINVRMEKDGLWGDLLYNPAHPLAEAVVWFAKNQPDCLGLSHNAIGEGRDDEDGIFVVEKIVDVRSVDMVADPATTKGLYEHCEDCDKENMDDEMLNQPADPDQGASEENYEEHIGHLVVAILQDDDMSLEEKKKKILQALKLMDDDGSEETEDSEEAEDEEEKREDHDEERDEDEERDHEECVHVLRKSKDRHVKHLLKAYSRVTRENKARQMCEAARVPATEVFIESLVRAKDEQAMRDLIEDRKAVVNKPRSAGRVQQKITVEEFVSKLKEIN